MNKRYLWEVTIWYELTPPVLAVLHKAQGSHKPSHYVFIKTLFVWGHWYTSAHISALHGSLAVNYAIPLSLLTTSIEQDYTAMKLVVDHWNFDKQISLLFKCLK